MKWVAAMISPHENCLLQRRGSSAGPDRHLACGGLSRRPPSLVGRPPRKHRGVTVEWRLCNGSALLDIWVPAQRSDGRLAARRRTHHTNPAPSARLSDCARAGKLELGSWCCLPHIRRPRGWTRPASRSSPSQALFRAPPGQPVKQARCAAPRAGCRGVALRPRDDGFATTRLSCSGMAQAAGSGCWGKIGTEHLGGHPEGREAALPSARLQRGSGRNGELAGRETVGLRGTRNQRAESRPQRPLEVRGSPAPHRVTTQRVSRNCADTRSAFAIREAALCGVGSRSDRSQNGDSAGSVVREHVG